MNELFDVFFQDREGKELRVGDSVKVVSGNFSGRTGMIIQINFLGAKLKFDGSRVPSLWVGPREVIKEKP